MSAHADPDAIRKTLTTMARLAGIGEFAIAASRVGAARAAGLFPAELASLPVGGAERLATFRAGRACARMALAELGLPPVAIPRDAAGAPRWPPGVCGSISHAMEVAAAIVVRNSPVGSIGLDLEEDGPLDDAGVAEVVCRPDELADLPAGLALSSLQYGKLLFVIKEAAYKLFWPLRNVFLEFQSLRVRVDPAAEVFEAEILSEAAELRTPRTSVVRGRYARAESLYIALAHEFAPGES